MTTWLVYRDEGHFRDAVDTVAVENRPVRAVSGVARYPDMPEMLARPSRPKKRASDTKATVITTPTEHAEQVAVMRWAKDMEVEWPELALLYAIPNFAGRLGHATARHGARLKAEGRKRGVPDLCLPVPRGIDHTSVYHGLYVELKRQRGGTVSPEQKQWHAALREQGYRVEVCKGAAAAIDTITRYLTHALEPDR